MRLILISASTEKHIRSNVTTSTVLFYTTIEYHLVSHRIFTANNNTVSSNSAYIIHSFFITMVSKIDQSSAFMCGEDESLTLQVKESLLHRFLICDKKSQQSMKNISCNDYFSLLIQWG